MDGATPQTATTPPRRLIGIGVGPGDPELVTLKAVRALHDAQAILVPATEASRGGAGRAEQIVLACCPQAAPAIRRIPFSMADRSGVTSRRREAWETSAQAALDAFADGATTVVFATVGDPSVYSTFSYLAGHVTAARDDVHAEIVPGITAMQALAASAGTPLVEGTEVLALVPVTAGAERYREALEFADTVVAYKGGRQLPLMLHHLTETGRTDQTVLGENIGLDREKITPATELTENTAPYFSTALTTPTRTEIGGRL
ncbi:precorrin-2 C20-methyltransferase /cobalt-factor II C20-methyltransferase [Austwickia chelonae]|uniref:Putative precorrin-2 C(20)-methyltransferase n=1 Tax=Austwickia chelonae NBRC 105200 TaxID=1184607 RepID=K6VP01_9MICO|nr:precorrin-2 C(20)-methyltransferase [Austwickia chelonae]GAB77085.1 putative precorrin-2 C(20)-methyltransferase [Austwickia chelonae NBRC 105200]SEW33875.1 precorrin-2 C20-methyltransferase /cobalt-factor II C20-methyltransferase [Austwickia chelonae]